jgi:hypothetical protein
MKTMISPLEKILKAGKKSAKGCKLEAFLPGPQNVSTNVKIITFKN